MFDEKARLLQKQTPKSPLFPKLSIGFAVDLRLRDWTLKRLPVFVHYRVIVD